jgi:hypothetical protein
VKTHKRLYERVCSFENVYRAYRQARRGKRYRNDALIFSADLERNLHDIASSLRDQSGNQMAIGSKRSASPSRA